MLAQPLPVLPVRILRRCFPFVILLLAVPASARRVSTIPLAPLPNQLVWTDAYQDRQGDAYEALGKMRAYQAAAKEAAAPVAAMDDYDVAFYDLNLDLDPQSKTLTGTVSITARVEAASLMAPQFNLRGNMVVSDVRGAGGGSVAFTHDGDILAVTLDRLYLQGEVFTVSVDYSGDPTGDYFGWDTYQTDPLVWSLSEPFGARDWWPCKDVNTDKADMVDINVTVPDFLIVASNGVLQGTSVPAVGKTTFHWQERYPICTYLVSLTAYPFVQFSETYVGLQGQTMPITNFVLKDKVAAATSGYAPTADMIHTFALAFGEYPFINEKYGHAHFPWGGGMEHQTCSSMAYNYYGETFVAHELSHQWFGDLITCADFHHIWLNEGFASWCEAYWLEQSQNEAAYHDKMAGAKYFGGGSIYVSDVSDFNVIFDYWHSYAKASWVVHMLRHVLGDADFFASLAAYRQAYAFSSATTEQFQAVCEAVSGLDLAPFFSEWIYGEYFPQYEVSWTTTPEGAGWGVDLRIAQTQTNTGVFTMPLDVRVTTTGGTENFTIQNDQVVQWYHLAVADQPSGVELDPEEWVLCQKSSTGVSAVAEALSPIPTLEGAVPNPFNPVTAIRFTLPEASRVQLVIYDVSGRRIRDLAPGYLEGGRHAVTWNGQDEAGRAVASGTYYARMTAGAVTQVRPLTLVR